VRGGVLKVASGTDGLRLVGSIGDSVPASRTLVVFGVDGVDKEARGTYRDLPRSLGG
jgi:hypothetical protein